MSQPNLIIAITNQFSYNKATITDKQLLVITQQFMSLILTRNSLYCSQYKYKIKANYIYINLKQLLLSTKNLKSKC